MSATLLLETKGVFEMKTGQITAPVIAYETWGELDEARDNCILIFTGLSPSAHAASSPQDPSAGWWEDMLGPGKPIDTKRYFVVCVNSLGSCFGSTGPASINPDTDDYYRLSFPVLSIEDVADSGMAVLDNLGIERVNTVVGASMGGMTALSFSLRHPTRVRRLVSISSGSKSQPYSIALRSLQREMIRSDPIWDNGNYEIGSEGPISGMRLARKLGMISYRSAAEWKIRFGRERASNYSETDNAFGIDFEVESYLEAQANRFTGAFDANCYLYLSRAMDLFDAGDHGGTIEKSFADLQLDSALIIGVKSDLLFPIDQQEELSVTIKSYIPDTKLKSLDSLQGHDSFLVDMDRFRPTIARFFES